MPCFRTPYPTLQSVFRHHPCVIVVVGDQGLAVEQVIGTQTDGICFLAVLALAISCSFLALRLSPVTMGTTAAWMCGVFSSMCRCAATTLSLPNVACSHWMLSLHHSSSSPFSCMFIMSSCVPDKTTRTTRTWSCVIFRLMPAVFSLWAIASSLP